MQAEWMAGRINECQLVSSCCPHNWLGFTFGSPRKELSCRDLGWSFHSHLPGFLSESSTSGRHLVLTPCLPLSFWTYHPPLHFLTTVEPYCSPKSKRLLYFTLPSLGLLLLRHTCPAGWQVLPSTAISTPARSFPNHSEMLSK